MTSPENKSENNQIQAFAGGMSANVNLELQRDEIILDRFKVIRLLGRGGMGSVYEVEHVHLLAHYALKFLNQNQTNEAAWRRFEI